MIIFKINFTSDFLLHGYKDEKTDGIYEDVSWKPLI